MIQYSRSADDQLRRRGVLDTRLRGYDTKCGAAAWIVAMMAPESLARSQNLKRRKHRLGDIGSAVPTAEFHRLDAVGINLVDGALDTLAGFGRRLQAVLVSEPV